MSAVRDTPLTYLFMAARQMIGVCRYIAILLILASQGALCESSVRLAYDDGEAEDCIWIDETRGHAVLFTAPSEDWTISGVSVYGRLVPKAGSKVPEVPEIFVIEVLDEDLNLVSKVTDVTYSFFGDELDWASVDIPNVKVSGDFFVCVYEFGGVYVGADLGPCSGRSFISARNPNRMLEWNLASSQRNQTDWMIWVLGNSPAPKVEFGVSSQVACEDKPVKVDLKAKDPDRNLKSAALYLMDNESREVVWSEVEPLDGGDAKIEFAWSGSMFQVSSKHVSIAPVFAVDNVDVVDYSENISSYLAYSAVCSLQLEPNRLPILAVAYFGEDGQFNALIDVDGIVHYMSREVLKVTKLDARYMDYKKNNVTLIEDKSSLTFGRIVVTPGFEELIFIPHEPIVLTGSSLFNYELQLERVDVGAREHLAIVVVEDRAYNVVRDVWPTGIETV